MPPTTISRTHRSPRRAWFVHTPGAVSAAIWTRPSIQRTAASTTDCAAIRAAIRVAIRTVRSVP